VSDSFGLEDGHGIDDALRALTRRRSDFSSMGQRCNLERAIVIVAVAVIVAVSATAGNLKCIHKLCGRKPFLGTMETKSSIVWLETAVQN